MHTIIEKGGFINLEYEQLSLSTEKSGIKGPKVLYYCLYTFGDMSHMDPKKIFLEERALTRKKNKKEERAYLNIILFIVAMTHNIG